MKFGNINTQEIVETLPSILVLNGQTITGADIRHWSLLGWRSVTQVDEPTAGFRVTKYGVQGIDGLTCKLIVSAQVNIADEQAAQAAAEAAAAAQYIADTKARAKVILDAGVEDLARALRALATIALQEINTLRTKAGLSTYTAQQFLTALQNKIDDQT